VWGSPASRGLGASCSQSVLRRHELFAFPSRDRCAHATTSSPRKCAVLRRGRCKGRRPAQAGLEEMEVDRHAASPEGAPPRANHGSLENDAGVEQAAAVKTLRVPGVEHGVPSAVGNEVLVERRQQVRLRRRGPCSRLVRSPVDLAIDDIGDQGRLDRFEPDSRLGRRQPGPPGEIGDRGRAATAKIAASELRERIGARQRPRWVRRPMIEKRIGGLLPPPRPAVDHRVGLRLGQQVGEPLTGG